MATSKVLLLVLTLLGGVALTALSVEAQSYSSYLDYFVQNPDVKSFTLDSLSLQEKLYFWEFVVELEENGELSIENPSDLGQGYFVEYSEDETSRIVAAKYAHAIWLDKNVILPWKLSDYSSSELRLLFDKSEIFDGTDRHASVSDHDPSSLYSSQKKFIKQDQTTTIFAILEDYRSDFRHGLNGEPNKEVAQSITGLVSADIDGFRVSYSGCHSMSKIIEYSLRNLNIPASEVFTRYGGGGHASVHFPTLDSYLLHGDDVYSAIKKTIPLEDLLMSEQEYSLIERSCDLRDRMCNDRLIHQWELDTMMPYLSEIKYHTQRCCRRDFGYDSCEEYVDSGFGFREILTSSMKEQIVDELKSVC